MNDVELKKAMMCLWKETFHDCDEYVKIVFDNYFCPDFVATEVRDGKLVSALLGVPYRFAGLCFNGASSSSLELRGLYLCGLATRPEHRHSGIMSTLIEEINDKAEKAGFDFTFLIPADDGLCRYYSDRGYVDAFRRVKSRYLPIHDFRRDLAATDENEVGIFDDTIISYIDKDCSENLAEFIDFIRKEEKRNNALRLQHSEKDMYAILAENALFSGKIIAAKNENDEYVGAAFCAFDSDENVQKIVSVYYTSKGVIYRLLDEALRNSPDKDLLVYTSPFDDFRSQQIYQKWGIGYPAGYENIHQIQTVDEVKNAASDAESYGMIRLLNKQRLLQKLVEASQNSGTTGFKIKDPEGFLSTVDLMDARQLAEVLFRRSAPDDTLSEMLSLPKLPVYMDLMLD